MRQRALATALMVMIGLALGGTGSAAAAGSITSYTAGLQVHSFPEHIVNGQDGNLWFTDAGRAIGRVAPSGGITEFKTGLLSGSAPFDITVGPDGNLWFTDPSGEGGTPAIGRITPSGTIAEFIAADDEEGDPISISEPLEIVSGPDGNLWFTDRAFVAGQPAIGKATASGEITEYKLPGWSDPSSIVVGPDGNLWYTNWGKAPNVQAIGKITPSGEVTEYLVPERFPEDIVSGPDGALWFSDARGAIGRITTGGTITEYSTGLLPGSSPSRIVVGPDGNLWFTDSGALRGVGRVTPSGSITEFPIGNAERLNPQGLTVGGDGNLWLANEYDSLYRITTSGAVTRFSFGLSESANPTDITPGPSGTDLWLTAPSWDGEPAIARVAPVGPSGTTPLPTLSVSTGGGGSGMVTSSPAGISCPAVCESQRPAGAHVTLTAIPAPGSRFVEWTNSEFLYAIGDQSCSGAGVCEITMDEDTNAIAVFEPEPTQIPNPAPVTQGTAPARQAAPGPASRPKKPLRCHKGFKKQKVHGKARCVKVKKKAHHRR